MAIQDPPLQLLAAVHVASRAARELSVSSIPPVLSIFSYFLSIDFRACRLPYLCHRLLEIYVFYSVLCVRGRSH